MIKNIIKRNGLLALALVTGLCLIPTLNRISMHKDKQFVAYSLALEYIAKKDVENATRAFDTSIAAFKEAHEWNWFDRFTLPRPSQELVALAYFHRANLLSMSGGKPEDVVEAYVNSLRFNNGQTLIEGASVGDDGLHQYGQDFCVKPTDALGMSAPAPIGADCVLMRLAKEAQDTRNNLQAYLDLHPEQIKMMGAGKMGKGSGGKSAKDGKKDPQPGSGMPGGNAADHDNPKDI